MQTSSGVIEGLIASPFHQSIFFVFIAFLVLPLLLKFIIKICLIKRTNSFKYRTSNCFFTPAEHSFFLVLKNALSNDFEIFAQVRIADVLEPAYPQYTRQRQMALNKITSKHFDYVLCDKQTLAIVASIELDDKSHTLDYRKARDNFIENACVSAGLKLIRFPCRRDYSSTTVRDKVFNSIKTDSL